MKKEKKKEHGKEVPLLHGKSMEEFLQSMELDEMIDDHGSVAIGRRDRKPRFPEESS